jgi:hypothetical protein
MKRVLALAGLVTLAAAPAAAAPAVTVHTYRSPMVMSITFRVETVPPRLQQAIVLALDRHALTAARGRGPRYSWQAVRPEYQTPDALDRARSLAAPWAGTELGIYAGTRCERPRVLAFQLAQIGLRGFCATVLDPRFPDIEITFRSIDYRGERVPGAVVARGIDHVVTSRRVGCLTYVPYVGVDLAALCLR